MKADKMPNMVTTEKPKAGRPIKFKDGAKVQAIKFPLRQIRRVRALCDQGEFEEFSTAARKLIDESLDRRGVVDPQE